MNRAIVLILCLTGAAVIAFYSYSWREGGEQAVVYTVPQRSEPAAKPPTVPPPKTMETPGDRVSLARSLQFELKRVGCYGGEINGVWTTSSRMAMKSFTDHVNASLPIDTPDYVLLSLVQGYQGQACTPSAATRTAKVAPTDIKADAADDRAGALVATGAAAAGAAAITATKPDAKAATPDDRARPTAASPQDSPPAGKGVPRDATTAKSGDGPVPPEGMQDGRPRRKQSEKTAQTPKFVRDFLRGLGFK